MRKKKSKKKLIIIIIALVLLASAATLIILKKNSENDSAQQTMTTATASTMTITNTLTSDGEIVSSLEEAKTPHTSYYLKKIKVEEGQALKEGDTILTYKNGKKMKAPYNCVVENWYLPDEGDQLTSEHYVTIAGTDVLQMEISVSEEDVDLIDAGDAAEVSVEATGNTYDATVTYVSEAGDYSDGGSTFTARIRFDNDGDLKLGMSGEATITMEEAEDVIGVPVNAVTTTDSSSYVTVISDGQSTETEVETGISNDSYIEIKSGLYVGDVVLVPVSDDDSSDGFGNFDFGGGNMPGGGGRSEGGSMPGGGSAPGGGSTPRGQ